MTRHPIPYCGYAPMLRPLGCALRYTLWGLVAFVALLVQVSHPGLHPLEVINPDADAHFACPLSHAAGDLLIILPLPALASLILWRLLAPRLSLERFYFNHRLAPRPPPTSSL